ncbi:MAG: dihydroorotate dehydrogenase-like protein [Phycisphaerales bacterium]|nr:MAG: dihydroorotate dehydrogenase-like protein [Phycisphaerales bacterium]
MNLSTTFMGLELKNPVVPSASPLTRDVSNIREMEDAGAGAIIMHSVFEEQLAHEAGELNHYLVQGTESFGEALSYFPKVDEFKVGPEEYLENIRKAKETAAVPIIASLNGVTVGGWMDYAKQIESAGADGLELNVYQVPTDANQSGREIEQAYIDILQAVKKSVKIPVCMKLSPFFSNTAWMAKKLDLAGADGLALFNRFYQPDINLDELSVEPGLILSSEFEMRLPLRWVAILHGYVGASLAATTGIFTGYDVIKMVMAGADITCLCSVLLMRGIGEMNKIIGQMTEWMSENEYASVEEMKGCMSHRSCPNPSEFERANYMKALNSYA